jgi:excinuclease ABC subunit C
VWADPYGGDIHGMDIEDENAHNRVEIDEAQLAQQVRNLGTAPGVYLFKDPTGKILYVGKAKNLKKRVQTYFQSGRPHDAKTGVLLTKVASLETIITHTEKEALILEANLIKKHRPRYNIHLKDDKRYPFLRLDVTQTFPNLNIVRKIQDDGARYFGPYASSAAVRQTLKFIHKTFKLRKCRNKTFANRTRPCLNYQMGLCMGPCCLDVAPEIYGAIVNEVTAFLKGRTPDLIRRIKKEMQSAAANQAYEQAAVFRDKKIALEKTLEKQVSVTTDFKDRDAFSMVSDETVSVVAMLRVRGGFLLGGRQFVFESAMGDYNDRMSVFLRQFYARQQEIPAEILVNHLPRDRAWIESHLSEKRGSKAVLLKPQRGEKSRLIKMASENASRGLEEHHENLSAHRDLMHRLKFSLRMEKLPQRIECFDNSNLSGTLPVSGMVVFQHGRPLPEAYRRYKIKSIGKPDDYAHMAEVLSRRFKKGKETRPLPDLLLVDGGKGQLNIATAVVEAMGLGGLFSVAGIAKKDESRSEETDKIYLPRRSNPVRLNKDPDLLLLLQRIRDEAHRFAIGYQRRRRASVSVASVLDGIAGIGPKRKRALLDRFGSVAGIRTATVEELSQLPGVSHEIAQRIHAHLHQG